MKKWVAALLCGLALLAGAASAQTYMFSDPENHRAIYTCEDFAGSMPIAAKAAFADVLREDDEILCGTSIQETWKGLEGKQGGSAMMAIRREGKLLLLGTLYDQKEGIWRAGVESDGFLPEGLPFSMTCMPDYSQRGVLRSVGMMLDAGDEQFVIRASSGGMLYLWEYIRKEPDGTQTTARYGNGYVDWGRRADVGKNIIFGDAGPIPARLCAWTFDSLPRTLEESREWIAPLSFDLAADEGYLSGVNLRERPTGKSKSFGIYRAKVQILGQKPGEMDPWMNVRLGNLEGWASGRYLKTQSEESPYELAEYQTTVSRVGRAKHQVQLLDRPDGRAIMTLEEGALVHVIMDHDGWLHVIMPRNTLTWQTDWDGTYGFVKTEDMTVGISKSDVMWR